MDTRAAVDTKAASRGVRLYIGIMQFWFWLWLAVALKIPLVGACWLIWYAVHHQSDQVVGGSGTFGHG